MRIAGLTLTASLLGLAVAAAQTPVSAPASAPRSPGASAGQAAKPATARPTNAIPRTADGHPDLQGNWTNATITPLERMRPNTPLVITEEEARLDESKTAAALEAREAPSESEPRRAAGRR
jgi:hypothetical protein